MAPKDPVDVPSFANTQLSLLDHELQSEIAETSSLVANHSPTALQRAGVALINLTVSSQRTGYGGKTVLELSQDSATSASGELPEHGIRSGDIVLVAEQPAGSAKKREIKDLEKKGVRGVVTRINKGAISVALDEGKEEAAAFGGRVWAVKLADEVTYKRYESVPKLFESCSDTKVIHRMNQTMTKLQKMGEAEYSSFIRVLFGLSSPSPVPSDLASDAEFGKLDWFDPTLNDSQKDAIRFALVSREIALIHGPPGVNLILSI
jgi:DNA polymerase alpha-associated DNA helicase A